MNEFAWWIVYRTRVSLCARSDSLFDNTTCRLRGNRQRTEEVPRVASECRDTENPVKNIVIRRTGRWAARKRGGGSTSTERLALEEPRCSHAFSFMRFKAITLAPPDPGRWL